MLQVKNVKLHRTDGGAAYPGSPVGELVDLSGLWIHSDPDHDKALTGDEMIGKITSLQRLLWKTLTLHVVIHLH